MTPFLYATPFPVTAFSGTQFEDGPTAWWQYPCAHVMLRGEETVERARTTTAGSTGEDVQLIYPDHKLVIWSELQIWSGVCPRGKNHFTVVAVAPCVDGSRRATRVVKKSAENLD